MSGVSRNPDTLMVSGLQLGLLGGSRCSEGGRGFFRLPLMGGLGLLGAAAADAAVAVATPEGGSLLVAALSELPLLSRDMRVVEEPPSDADASADAIVALPGIRLVVGLLHLKFHLLFIYSTDKLSF